MYRIMEDKQKIKKKKGYWFGRLSGHESGKCVTQNVIGRRNPVVPTNSKSFRKRKKWSPKKRVAIAGGTRTRVIRISPIVFEGTSPIKGICTFRFYTMKWNIIFTYGIRLWKKSSILSIGALYKIWITTCILVQIHKSSCCFIEFTRNEIYNCYLEIIVFLNLYT